MHPRCPGRRAHVRRRRGRSGRGRAARGAGARRYRRARRRPGPRARGARRARARRRQPVRAPVAGAALRRDHRHQRQDHHHVPARVDRAGRGRGARRDRHGGRARRRRPLRQRAGHAHHAGGVRPPTAPRGDPRRRRRRRCDGGVVARARSAGRSTAPSSRRCASPTSATTTSTTTSTLDGYFEAKASTVRRLVRACRGGERRRRARSRARRRVRPRAHDRLLHVRARARRVGDRVRGGLRPARHGVHARRPRRWHDRARAPAAAGAVQREQRAGRRERLFGRGLRRRHRRRRPRRTPIRCRVGPSRSTGASTSRWWSTTPTRPTRWRGCWTPPGRWPTAGGCWRCSAPAATATAPSGR